LEDKPLKTSRKKTALPLPTDPKQLQILNEFKDYDFTRSISEAERDEQIKRVLENSKQLEESRSKIGIEEMKDTKEEDDEEEELEMGEYVDGK
jgi:hypothetical protein